MGFYLEICSQMRRGRTPGKGTLLSPVGSVDYVVGNYEKYKAKRQPEPPQDKYSRRTAHATIAMAGFTLVLIGVNYFQLKDIQRSETESSSQTNQMIKEYRAQVAQLKRQAGDTHDLAVAAKAQSDQTKTIADQAVIQANAAKSAANLTLFQVKNSDAAVLDFQVGIDQPGGPMLSIIGYNFGHVDAVNVVGTFDVSIQALPSRTKTKGELIPFGPERLKPLTQERSQSFVGGFAVAALDRDTVPSIESLETVI